MAVYLWLAIVGTLGSWAVLVPTKFSEGKVEDQGPMRDVAVRLGRAGRRGGLDAGRRLIVHVPSGRRADRRELGHDLARDGSVGAASTGGNPSLPMYVTYFAFLFVILRWWRQAEFTREPAAQSVDRWRCACSGRG